MAFKTEKPPNGVSGSSLIDSSVSPIFFTKISRVYLMDTGTSPNSRVDKFGTRLLLTVVVLTYKNVISTLSLP